MLSLLWFKNFSLQYYSLVFNHFLCNYHLHILYLAFNLLPNKLQALKITTATYYFFGTSSIHIQCFEQMFLINFVFGKAYTRKKNPHLKYLFLVVFLICLYFSVLPHTRTVYSFSAWVFRYVYEHIYTHAWAQI